MANGPVVNEMAATLPWRDRVEVFAVGPGGKIYGGRWDNDKSFALPGGGMESGETPLTAALRELSEETGISAVRPKLLMSKPVLHPWSDRHREKTKRNFAGTRTYFVKARVSGDPANMPLDYWGATDKRYYSPEEALGVMLANTNYLAPSVAEARLSILNRLVAASKKRNQQSGAVSEKL